jgi:antitoxin HigA-1
LRDKPLFRVPITPDAANGLQKPGKEQFTMPMKNPPHPGEIIRVLYIKPLGLTVTKAAEGLGVTRKTFSLLLNDHAGISPEMAVRLSQSFQAQYDLAQARRWSKVKNLGRKPK